MSDPNEETFELTMNQFNQRFRPLQKIEDLFLREYILCWDQKQNLKIISKNYSVETNEQKKDVRENMENFIKLNRLEGVCKLVCFAEEDDELRAVFECHGEILAKYIEQMVFDKNRPNKDQSYFFNLYIFLFKQLIKIILSTQQIGMELDDISRDNIIVFNCSGEGLPECMKVLYDERQKQYDLVIQPNIFYDKKNVKRYPNKLYWSPEKIYSQIINDAQYWSQQGQQSIHQIGLLLLDIIYECETRRHLSNNPDENKALNDLGLLDPDSSLINVPEKKRAYYSIDKFQQQVKRDQAFIAHKLNYLISSNQDPLKMLALLIKNMIIQTPQMRYDINKVIMEVNRIDKLISVNSLKGNRPYQSDSQNQIPVSMNSEGQHKNIRESYESQKNGFILSKQYSEGMIKDSLKYSENSLSLNEQLRFGQQSHQEFHPARKQVTIPLSSITTITESPNKKTIRETETTKQGHSYEHIGLSEKQIISEQDEQHYQSMNNTNMVSGKTIRSKNSLNIDQQTIQEMIIAKSTNIDPQLRIQLNNILLKINQLNHQTDQISIREYSDGSVYYGSIDRNKDKRSGLGIYMYKAGDIYLGNWADNALPAGIFLFKNGQSYIGPIRKGKQGKGQYHYANGNVYEGHWKDDLKHGQGTMIYGSGAKYEGEWVKGKKHGFGRYFYENGLIYEGGFVLGKKYGNGTFLYPNRTKITGFWENNCLEGKAIVEYYNGDRFEGEYHYSEKNGEGQYRWSSDNQIGEQICYKGEFKKDNLEGSAMISFQNGERYEGNVKNGKRQGEGKYYYKNGDQFHGIWKQDKKQLGKYIFVSGEIFEGKFKNGQISFGSLKYVNGDVYQGEFVNGERHGAGNYTNKEGKIIFEGRWERDQFLDENMAPF